MLQMEMTLNKYSKKVKYAQKCKLKTKRIPLLKAIKEFPCSVCTKQQKTRRHRLIQNNDCLILALLATNSCCVLLEMLGSDSHYSQLLYDLLFSVALCTEGGNSFIVLKRTFAFNLLYYAYLTLSFFSSKGCHY